jgi:hypothetical protein
MIVDMGSAKTDLKRAKFYGNLTTESTKHTENKFYEFHCKKLLTRELRLCDLRELCGKNKYLRG